MACADPPSKGVGVHPISVLELTNNKVVGGGGSLADCGMFFTMSCSAEIKYLSSL